MPVASAGPSPDRCTACVKVKGMDTITKDTTIGDILEIKPDAVPVLMEIGMHCIGCPSSIGETIEQAAMVHGVDADMLVKRLNEA